MSFLGVRHFALLVLVFLTSPIFAGPVTVPANFAKGWNLAGNSTTEALDVRATFGSYEIQKPVTPKVVSVWKWNGATQRWAFYTTRMPATQLRTYVAEKGYDPLWVVRPGEGYWVNTADSFDLPESIASGTEKLPLVKGWNLSAFGRAIAPADLDVLIVNATGSSASTYWSWDTATQTWAFFAPSLYAKGGADLKTYAEDKSYIDFVSTGRRLLPGQGFWVNSSGAGTVDLPAPPASTSIAQSATPPTVNIELQPNVVVASADLEDALVYSDPPTAYSEGTLIFKGTPAELSSLKTDQPLILHGQPAKVASVTVYPDGNGGQVTTIKTRPATLDDVVKSVSVVGDLSLKAEDTTDADAVDATGMWRKMLSQTVPLGDNVTGTLSGTLTLAPTVKLDYQRSLGVVTSAKAQLISDVTLDITAKISGAADKTWEKELFRIRRWIPNQLGLPLFAVVPVSIGLKVATEGSVTSGYVGNLRLDAGAELTATGIVGSNALSYGATAKQIDALGKLTVSPFLQPSLQIDFLNQPLIGMSNQLGVSMMREVGVTATATTAERCTTDSASWDLVGTGWAEVPAFGRKSAGIYDLHPELMAAKRTCKGIPIANPGPDRSELAGTTVQLYGTQSTPSVPGALMAYDWKQVAIDGVTPITSTAGLDNSASPTPTFRAPDYPTRMKFQLVVTDDSGQVSQPKAVTLALQYNPEVAAKKTLVKDGGFWAAGEAWHENCGTYCFHPLVVGADPTQVLMTWTRLLQARHGREMPSGAECYSMHCTKEGPCYFEFNGNEPNIHYCTFGNLPQSHTTLQSNAPAGCAMGEIAVKYKTTDDFSCQ